MSYSGEAPAALVSLVEQHQDRLVGLLTLHTGSRESAEDLAQDTVERACAHWEHLRDHPAPERWLYRVALNLATSRWRRIRRWNVVADRVGRDAMAQDGVEGTRRSDHDVAVSLDLRREVAALPVRERDTLICRYYLDLSVAGTAEVLGCPENTVKTLTRRGLEQLRLSYGLGQEVTDER